LRLLKKIREKIEDFIIALPVGPELISEIVFIWTSKAASAVSAVGLAKYVGITAVISAGFMRYMTHGIFEILGYFVGGLAGGIISVAVVRHDFGTKKFSKILLDSSDLLLLSVFILLVAAVVEVYVTPILF